ncbi:MAG: class I SAM-dependent methyltransferase [Gaiellaceae bacterium]
MKAYYHARAPEYDEWYRGLGRFDGLERPHWDDELHELEQTLAALPPLWTLDVACGTGFLTKHLPGRVVALDQSEAMLAAARAQAPAAELVLADALDLPFPDGSFERVFTGHFYGHLEEPDRLRFLAEARRVGGELVVCDAALRPDTERVLWQERVLNDGSRWQVFKRYFDGEELAAELGGGEVIFQGRWFVVVRV